MMFNKGDWKDLARTYYNDEFYLNNDAGHRIDHADDVYKEMIRLNKYLDLNMDEDLIFMVAYTHDIFTHTGRKNHHSLARDYVIGNSDKFLEQFDTDELRLIGQAVNEHRASGKDHYSNDYARLIRLADKGSPNLDKILMRSYMSSKHKYTSINEEMAVEVVLHLRDKYGREGYGFKSVDYRKVYGHKLSDFWRELDNITPVEWVRRVKLGVLK